MKSFFGRLLCWLGIHKWTYKSSIFTKDVCFCQRCSTPRSDGDVVKLALYVREELLWADTKRLKANWIESYEYVRTHLGGHR